MADLLIADLLRELGFESPAAQVAARAALALTWPTKPGKERIAAAKRDLAPAALARVLAPVCAHPFCRELLRPAGRQVVEVAARGCEVCHGSNNLRAISQLRARMLTRGFHRLLVVGGTPARNQELARLLSGGSCELRVVDGISGNHTARQAETNMAWADLVAIWAPAAPLPHKVSDLYTTPLGRRAVVVRRPGIEALVEELLVRLG